MLLVYDILRFISVANFLYASNQWVEHRRRTSTRHTPSGKSQLHYSTHHVTGLYPTGLGRSLNTLTAARTPRSRNECARATRPGHGFHGLPSLRVLLTCHVSRVLPESQVNCNRLMCTGRMVQAVMASVFWPRQSDPIRGRVSVWFAITILEASQVIAYISSWESSKPQWP